MGRRGVKKKGEYDQNHINHNLKKKKKNPYLALRIYKKMSKYFYLLFI